MKTSSWLRFLIDCREVLTKPITKIVVPNQFPGFLLYVDKLARVLATWVKHLHLWLTDRNVIINRFWERSIHRAVGRCENSRGTSSNVVGTIWPPVWIGVTDLPKYAPPGHLDSRFLRPWFRIQRVHTLGYKPSIIGFWKSQSFDSHHNGAKPILNYQ